MGGHANDMFSSFEMPHALHAAPSLWFHAFRVFWVCKHHLISLWDFIQKIGLPNSVTYLNRTHDFKWYALRCGSKNGCQKEICLNKIGLVCSKLDVHSKFNSQRN